MSFAIAIPSYKRPRTLVKKTLAFLAANEIPIEWITIFLASEAEKIEYQKVLAPGYNLIVGVPGIHAQRNFIENFYPVGQKLLCIDDDLSRLKMICLMPLKEAVDKMFAICEAEQCYMWGILPYDHTMSLVDEYIVGLRYVIGVFHGLIIKEPRLPPSPSPFYEDFYRTVETFKRDGKVIRFNGFGPTTRYFKEPGGLQEFRTLELQDAAMTGFKVMYPEFCKLRRREGKYTDVRLTLVTQKRVEHPFTSPQ